MPNLTDKQKQAAKEYLIDLNQTKALERAGYSKKTAKQQACRLFTNVYFQEYVQKLMQERTERVETDANWVLTRLTEVAERCMQAEPVLMWEDGKRVPSGEFKFDSSGANRALELIGKHHAMFVDRVQHNMSDAPYEVWKSKIDNAE